MDANALSVWELFAGGTLIAAIVEEGVGQNPSRLLEECITLHQSGKIDVIGLVNDPSFDALRGHDFFVVQHFFCELIPRLDKVPVEKMMDCVAALVRKGGADLMANRPN